MILDSAGIDGFYALSSQRAAYWIAVVLQHDRQRRSADGLDGVSQLEAPR